MSAPISIKYIVGVSTPLDRSKNKLLQITGAFRDQNIYQAYD